MWRLTIYYFSLIYFTASSLSEEHTKASIIRFAKDTLIEINTVYNKTDYIRQQTMHTPAFEVGFVLRSMEECYRRMVDIYNSSMTTDLYNLDAITTDHIVFLKHIEILYWVVDHLANMLHEVEKKYKIKNAGMFAEHRVWTTPKPFSTKRHRFQSVVPRMTTTTKRPRQTWWPLDYGWEMDYKWR